MTKAMLRTTCSFLVALAYLGCSGHPLFGPIMNDRWKELGVPQEGITLILSSSDEHGFFANYSGLEHGQLLQLVSEKLEAAGYEEACSIFDGRVVGFKKGEEELGVKVDLLGGEVGLSVFDSQSHEEMLLGLCFGRYSLGEPEVIKEGVPETP